ncbi:SMC-Scp complex subunit ScpB [Candidatus Falkowbacteria bacterium]|nr:SMC-Scp complex subunit ScpB [Candidatus Falkowbacteria bacterium]
MKTKIESLLFISNKPLSIKWLVNFLSRTVGKVEQKEVERAIDELKKKYNIEESGARVIQTGEDVQMVTAPSSADIVKTFLKDDMTGELTPASLETLTVIAYRGPITKIELEQIRGVNCSLIIRNLLIRGLIDVYEERGQNYYQVTTDFLKYLGLDGVEQLPDYEKLHQAKDLEQYLQSTEQNRDS